MDLRKFTIFIAISAGYHGFLTGFLLFRAADFRVESTGELLQRVNLPNTLTFGRLSSIPTVLFLIAHASRYPLLPIVLPFLCLVFATDLLDGIIARRRREITFVGRYLDSSSDYVMIIAVSITLFDLHLVPLWFFVLILSRLLLFAIGMLVLALRQGKTNPLATFLGKASIFATMVFYVLAVAQFLDVPWIGEPIVVRIVEYLVTGIIVASFVDKAVFLAKRFAGTPTPGETPTSGRSI
jgi:CDP-diacylglycerol--glycerol-3-phosphate 3-phosphatidyltransferase